MNPILRTNLFHKVTDVACRLPLQAADLGDLMRLWVRSGVQINLFFGFSMSVGNASDTSNDKKKAVTKKRQRFPKLPPALPNSFTLPNVIHVLVGEHQLHSLSRYEAKPACAEHPCLLGSTNHGQLLFT